MTVPSVPNRLGLDPFGTENARIGNFLLYPRRVVLEVLKLAFTQADLFTPTAASGISTERNPFLLTYAADGSVAPDSRIVLVDYGSELALKTEARPRIVIERAAGAFSGRTAFSRRNPGDDAVDRRSDLYESGLTIRCVARLRLESELLALIVQMLLQMFSEEIKRKSELFHLSTPSVSPTMLERGDAAADQYATTVTLSTVQTVQWVKTKINTQVIQDLCVSVAAIAL